jgi:hypothetical protein
MLVAKVKSSIYALGSIPSCELDAMAQCSLLHIFSLSWLYPSSMWTWFFSSHLKLLYPTSLSSHNSMYFPLITKPFEKAIYTHCSPPTHGCIFLNPLYGNFAIVKLLWRSPVVFTLLSPAVNPQPSSWFPYQQHHRGDCLHFLNMFPSSSPEVLHSPGLLPYLLLFVGLLCWLLLIPLSKASFFWKLSDLIKGLPLLGRCSTTWATPPAF